jgi:hypothetical protein
MSSAFISPVTFIRNTDNVSYQIDITTTNSTGTFAVQVSNDYSVGPDNTVVNPGTWLTLTLSGIPTAAGANDIIGISLNQLPYDSIRFTYTPTVAGTGTLTAILTSKQIGG